MELKIKSVFDKTIVNTVAMFAGRYLKAICDSRDTSSIREAFDDYIDMLFENGRITDNQHEFLELWFVWDVMDNDSGA